MGWIYRYESKGIQRLILDSNQLRDLAAGSYLVEDLVAAARSEIEKLGGDVVAAAAGGATALFPTRETLEAFTSVPTTTLAKDDGQGSRAVRVRSYRSAAARFFVTNRIIPLYAFTLREGHEKQQADGSVRKVQVFRHVGFVEPPQPR